ncbi:MULTISPECIES: hypothetical protein [Bacillus cereus group]|uniref:hypothetical protein n=1 Tax=Bacillus cereus group TaxID=86661 RepID=UPI001F19371E|nr:hypothetical protein [Bacillus cereus]MDA1521050.1 hypothetical protein [Bacillus cereus]BCC09494.1 hypothetical protein BCM0060_p2160 [Bacillus cereus]BCC16481.1 hypothetical protein BCM0075_1251 [Bacillus cereus]BCC50412.1 hypothetical protein BCJMU02_p2006 [Bacillus cereus]BCD08926.1 hypothetical protein BC30052_p2208 [Bacillus cereus]
MAKKKTHEEFVAEVKEKVGDEYTVLGQYVKTDTKIVIRHNSDLCQNYEHPFVPYKFLSGDKRCPLCRKINRISMQTKSHESFVKEVYDLVGDEFSVVGTYIGSHKNIQFRHNTCGRIFDMQPSNFLSGQRCRECSNEKARLDQAHTTDRFKEDVSNLVGAEYTVIGEYYNNHTDITMKHNDCGYEYPVKPSNFKSGKGRCPKCNDGYQLTSQLYRDMVYELVGDEYTILGNYKLAHEGVYARHNVCGYEWYPTPFNFLGGARCPKCRGNLLKTHEEFIQEVYELVGEEYTVLGGYISSSEKILMRHNTCGIEYLAYPSKFVGSEQTRCRECSINIRAEKRRKTTEQFIEDLFDAFGEEYTVLGEYLGSKEPILVRHNPCGEKYYKSPVALMRRNCKTCSDIGQRKTHEQFVQDVYNLVRNDYAVLGEYIGVYEDIQMKHNICGHTWNANPHKFVNGGRRCPRCNESKGEAEIRRFLEYNDIDFDTQQRFDECVDEKPLPFDFVIFDKGGISMLIEFDGIQHHEPVERFGGEEAFEKVQKHDKIKTEFCEQSNIKLVRIPYWEIDNVGSILSKELGLSITGEQLGLVLA